MSARRIQFKGLSERLAEIDVNVTRNIEFVAEGDAGDGVLSEDSSHFNEVLGHWTQQNRTLDFSLCSSELKPLAQSLPMIVFNLEQIVAILLRHAVKPNTMASEPILMLIGALARDMRSELTPFFGRIFNVLADLLGVATRVTQQNPELVEQVFQCFAFLLKYLARYVAEDLPTYLSTYSTLLRHPKAYVRHFAGETMAFIVRRLRARRLEAALEDLFRLLSDETLNDADLAALADGLGVILFEATKNIQRKFHSQMRHVVWPLLSQHVRPAASATSAAAAEKASEQGAEPARSGDMAFMSPAVRAAQLWAVKAALLRMRNHADGVEGAADVLELVFKGFRQAVRRYDTTPANAARLSAHNGEVLFYADLIVDWVTAKPRQNTQSPGWTMFAEAALDCLGSLLQAARARTDTVKVLTCSEVVGTSSLRFPPKQVTVVEAAARAVCLLWRALPAAIRPLCDEELVESLMGGVGSLPSVLQEEALCVLASSTLPDLLGGLDKTPLLPVLLGTAVDLVSGKDAITRDPPLRIAAVYLCGAILRHAGSACLSPLVMVLHTSKSWNSLLGDILDLAGVLTTPSPDGVKVEGSLLPITQATVATQCAMALFRATRESSRPEGAVVPENCADRFASLARYVDIVAARDTSTVQRLRADILCSRLISCVSNALIGRTARSSSAPPADSWPARRIITAPMLSLEGPLTWKEQWAAWFLSWAVFPELRAPALRSTCEALTILSESCEETEAQPHSLRRLALGPAMARCRRSAGSCEWQLRRACVDLAGLLPVELLLKQLESPVTLEEEADQAEEEQETWCCTAVGVDVDECAEDEVKRLLGCCVQLQNTDADMANERQRAELMRRIARSVRRLPRGSWLGAVAVQALMGEFFVKLSTNWGPAREALLHIASEHAEEEAKLRPRDQHAQGGVASSRKRRKKKVSTDAGPESTKVAAELTPSKRSAPADAAEVEAAAKRQRRSAVEGDDNQDLEHKKEQEADEAPDRADDAQELQGTKKVRKRKERKGGKEQEEDPEDTEAKDHGLEEVHLAKYLTTVPGRDRGVVDWSKASAGWWWAEMVWAAALRLISEFEAPHRPVPNIANDGDVEEEDDIEVPQPKMKHCVYGKKPKKDRWQLDGAGPLGEEVAPLWSCGAQGWRTALEHVWEETSQWETPHTSGLTLHGLAWELVAKLLEQNVWGAKGGTLAPWQDRLGQHHTDWVLAKCVQHMRDRYGTTRVVSMRLTGNKASLAHALKTVAAMPSIERCARPLVQFCIHGCVHWLLREQDVSLQELAISVLSRCRRTFPYMPACEASLKRLCNDSTFHHELIHLSVEAREEGEAYHAQEAADPEAGESVLHKYRDELLPIVLRILFSKATKKGKAIDKRSTKATRRGSIFSYLSALTEEEQMPELLLVLLEPLMLILTSTSEAVGEAESLPSSVRVITSAVQKVDVLRKLFSLQAGDDAQQPPCIWWATGAVAVPRLCARGGGLSVEDGREDDAQEHATCSWAWQLLLANKRRWAIVNPFVRPQVCMGLLEALGDVIPQMADKLTSYAPLAMRLVATLIERVGTVTQTQGRAQQAQYVRQILRLAILRMRDLLDRYSGLAAELIVAVKPAAATLEFLFERLESTAGAVSVSSVVLLAGSWARDPSLFCCFKDLCPRALPSLFRVPAGDAVRAALASGERSGDVVPLVVEVALRLCRGGVLDIKGMKKARRQYSDIKREQKARKKVHGDDDSDAENFDAAMDGSEDDENVVGWSQQELEANMKSGVELIQPHVNVLLRSFRELIQHRLVYKNKQKASARGSGKSGGPPAQRFFAPLVTSHEIALLAAVGEWCTDPQAAHQLIELLLVALSEMAKDRRASAESMTTLVTSLRRLAFIALPVDAIDKAAAGATAADRPLAVTVSKTVVRLLGQARDVMLRERLAEFLVDVEALHLFRCGETAKQYLEDVKRVDFKYRWQPDINTELVRYHGKLLGPTAESEANTFSALHVAHLIAALNILRRGALKEPDVDAHVEVLSLLCDHYLSKDVSGLGDHSPKPRVILQASLLSPLILQCLFILRCLGMDFGVKHGVERVLGVLAERLAASAVRSDADSAEIEDSQTLLRVELGTVIPALRKMLRANDEDIYRTGLRILAHHIRSLAPHCSVLQAWQPQPQRKVDTGPPTSLGLTDAPDALEEDEHEVEAVDAEEPTKDRGGSVASSVFGSSAVALLHADLLPFVRLKAAQGDEGGDLLGNLLHLQKHRRGRGLNSLAKAAEDGRLTSNSLSHFVIPICMQALLQRGSSTAAFDPNYAEVAVKCLGHCMRGVAWSSCLNTVRFLSTMVAKHTDARDRWIVRAICECLSRFPFPQRELPTPETAGLVGDGRAWATMGLAIDDTQLVLGDVEDERKSKGKGKGKKGRKGKGKGCKKGKGKGKSESSSVGPVAVVGGADAGEVEEGADRDGGATSENKEGVAKKEAPEQASDESASSSPMVRSLRAVIIPILKKMAWQKEPGKSGAALAGSRSADGSGRGGHRSGGLVRIGVIGVMMHCVTHLPPGDFLAELPRVLALVTSGLQARDVDHRRAARQALQRVAVALGPAWLGWIVRELRERLYRGFMIPVCASAASAALQALAEGTLKPGDLDNAFAELVDQVERELARVLDNTKFNADIEEERTGQVPEAKKLRGPELMHLAAQFTSPKLVADALWRFEHQIRGDIGNEVAVQKKGAALSQAPGHSLTHVRRVEELMQRLLSGLFLNSHFTLEPQVRCTVLLLQVASRLLRGEKDADASQEAITAHKAKTLEDDPIQCRVATSRDERFTVQPGAAAGRAAPMGYATNTGAAAGGEAQKRKGAGADEQTRAGILGVLGLKLLQHVLRKRCLQMPVGEPSTADAVSEYRELFERQVVPSVVACFCSRQDRLFVASARCLGLLRGLYAARPEVLGAHGALIAKTVLKTFEIVAGAPQLSQHLEAKLRQRGLAGANSTALLATSTKLLSALLNNRQSVEWFKPLGEETVSLPQLLKDGEHGEDSRFAFPKPAKKRRGAAEALAQGSFFDALITHIRSALDQPALQPSALQLLRRVLLRNRMLSAAVYQCVDAIGEVMIESADKRAAQQCAQIYVDFMLDYPHEPKALQQRLGLLVRNIGYAEESGRHAVLNCLYLVVTTFPEDELASRWATLIFAGAAARLPQENDPVAHQMLHVLLKALLGRIGANGRQKLLDLTLSWGRSPKLGLHLAQAECLGLFAEASGGGSQGAGAAVLQQLLLVLAYRADSILVSEKARSLAQDESASSPNWRVSYAVIRAFERILASFTPAILEKLPATAAAAAAISAQQPASSELKEEGGRDADEPSKGARKEAGCGDRDKPGKRARKEASPGIGDVTPMSPQPSEPKAELLAEGCKVPARVPSQALSLLWRFSLSGHDVFTNEARHAWITSVALRILESQISRCCAQGSASILYWFGSGVNSPSLAVAAASEATALLQPVTVANLMRATEALLSDERVERDNHLAPLGVRALCAITRLVLSVPELMPEGAWGEEDVEGEMVGDAISSIAPRGVDDVAAAAAPEAPSSVSLDVDETRKDDPTPLAEKAAEVDDAQPARGNDAEAARSDDEKVAKVEGEDNQEEEMDDEAVMAGGDLECERQFGPSLFDAVGGSAVRSTSAVASSLAPSSLEVQEAQALAVLPRADTSLLPAPPGSAPEDILRRSRVRWLVVRISQRARSLLSRPSLGFVRLVSMLRFLTALAEFLPIDLLRCLLEPMLSPAYRCASGFPAGMGGSALPDVKSLEDALNLDAALQMEFLGQLGQACLDALTNRLQEAGQSSAMAAALAKVRKAVERRRSERVQKKRLLPVLDPEGYAVQKRAKLKKKQEGKKRRVQEVINRKKGGKGRTRVKQSVGLV